MKQVYTGKDIDELVAAGKDPAALNGDAVLTPSARDRLRALGREAGAGPAKGALEGREYKPVVPDFEYSWKPGGDPKGRTEIERFFNSPEIVRLKERMCDIGRRMWERNYVDGNGGNVTIRVGDNLALCTPTLISKGFIKPEDICLVDLDANQLAGWRARTSEAKTHFGIMKVQPAAKACVHAHPPHGTAFAVAGLEPPTCLIPEPEVFLGKIGLATYATPGTPENSEEVAKVGKDHQAVLMQNHGVICWGKDVEDAYWKMENVEAYCQTLLIASQLGRDLGQGYGPKKVKELIEIRKQLGMADYRENWDECQLCDNQEFRPGFYADRTAAAEAGDAACSCSTPGPAPDSGSARYDPQAEAVVKQITDTILARLKP